MITDIIMVVIELVRLGLELLVYREMRRDKRGDR